MDINWSKTKYMFISKNSKIKIPKQIEIGTFQVEVVDKFRLLGIDLDSTLSFSCFLANIVKCTNRRLFAIKRLFFISHRVKTQFFKTFILPYFDYCSTLVILNLRNVFHSNFTNVFMPAYLGSSNTISLINPSMKLIYF